MTYTITLTNSGDGIATVRLTDTLAREFAAGNVVRAVTVPGKTWNTVEGTATVSFTATTPITPGLYTNRAITITYDVTQTVIADTAPVSVTAPATGLTLVKTASAAYARSGQTITFTIGVTNSGLAALAPITITDALAPACSQVLTAGLTVGQGSSYTCTQAITADLTNVAVATGTAVNGIGQPPVITATASAQVTMIDPALQLDKTAAAAVIRSGGTASFTLTVTNTGNITLTGLALTDAACDTPPTLSATTLAASGVATATCTVSGRTATFTNTASVSGLDPLPKPSRSRTRPLCRWCLPPANLQAAGYLAGHLRQSDHLHHQPDQHRRYHPLYPNCRCLPHPRL